MNKIILSSRYQYNKFIEYHYKININIKCYNYIIIYSVTINIYFRISQPLYIKNQESRKKSYYQQRNYCLDNVAVNSEDTIMITINAIGAYMKKFIFYLISVLVYTAYKTTQPTRAVKIHKTINIIPCSTRLQHKNTNRIKYSYHPA